MPWKNKCGLKEKNVEAILIAEGQKTAAILEAEGRKQAAILNAEAIRESSIREAEGKRQAKILEAQGEAEAILTVQKAFADSLVMIKEASADDKVLALKALEASQRTGRWSGNQTNHSQRFSRIRRSLCRSRKEVTAPGNKTDRPVGFAHWVLTHSYEHSLMFAITHY